MTKEKSKCYCERCGDEFRVPQFAIDMVYARYCKPCIKIGLKAYAKLSAKQVIEMECKSLGL